MIIVGNGRVGKTSMFKQLNGDKFNPEEKFTHGVQLGILDEKKLPLPTDGKTNTLNLVSWDFGGQEIFYATHQFFLSQEALYVLAWTDRKHVEAYLQRESEELPMGSARWREREEWLDNIRNIAPKSPILMVQTHADRKKIPINEADYAQEPYKATCLAFDAAIPLGLEELKKHIVQKLENELELYGQNVANQYLDVVEEVVNLAKTVDYIDMATFQGICERKGLTGDAYEQVRGYLHRTGAVVYLGSEACPRLKDIIYINPNWLTQQVYLLINNKLEARKGEIDSDYLDEVFPKDPKEKTARTYTEEEIARFLELVTQFELIFQDPEDPDLYYAPQYLPENPDRTTQRMIKLNKGLDRLAFVFRFPKYVPENVMINFVSRYGPNSHANTVPWKHGICFEFEGVVSCLVRFEPKEAGEPPSEFRVYIEEHNRAAEAAYTICEAFVKLSRRANAHVSVDGEHFVDWARLIEMAEDNEGAGFIRTVAGNHRVAVREFGELLNIQSDPLTEGEYRGFKKTPQGLRDRPRKVDKDYVEKDRFLIESSSTPPVLKIPILMSSLQQLVATGNLEEALQLLTKLVPSRMTNDVILLRGRYSRLQRDIERRDTRREDLEIEENRIQGAILSLARRAGILDQPSNVESSSQDKGGDPVYEERGFNKMEPDIIKDPKAEDQNIRNIEERVIGKYTLILNLSYDKFRNRIIEIEEKVRVELSISLQIDKSEIQISSIKRGSIKIVLKLREDAGQKLLSYYKDGGEIIIEIDGKKIPLSLDHGVQKILFLAANPTDQARMQTDLEYATIEKRLTEANFRDSFDLLKPKLSLTIVELIRAMNQSPQIVHFAGHGTIKGIMITTEGNQTQIMPTRALNRLFRKQRENVRLVILNACYSAEQAQAISSLGFCVFGMNAPIGDNAAVDFASGVYLGLGEGKSLENAFNDALIILETKHPHFDDIPEAWYMGEKLDWK